MCIAFAGIVIISTLNWHRMILHLFLVMQDKGKKTMCCTFVFCKRAELHHCVHSSLSLSQKTELSSSYQQWWILKLNFHFTSQPSHELSLRVAVCHISTSKKVCVLWEMSSSCHYMMSKFTHANSCCVVINFSLFGPSIPALNPLLQAMNNLFKSEPSATRGLLFFLSILEFWKVWDL
jgi:hypothetical protein